MSTISELTDFLRALRDLRVKLFSPSAIFRSMRSLHCVRTSRWTEGRTCAFTVQPHV